MKASLSIGLVVASFAFDVVSVAPSALADEPPRACTMDDPDLAVNEPGVVEGYPIFNYNNSNYNSEIFGLAEADTHSTEPPYLICRRYEFKNKSSKVIQELRWPDIGVSNITTTPPGERYRFPKSVLSNTTDVKAASTELFAWENIRAPSRTVFPLKVQIDKRTNFDPRLNWIYALSPKALPSALDGISIDGLSLDATQSFYAPDESFTYPTLQAGLVSDDLSFLIFSSAAAYPGERYVESFLEIQAWWKREGEPGLFAPGIVTLAEIDFAPSQNVQERIRSFASALSEHTSDNRNSLLSEKISLGYLMADDASQPILFVVDQPVRLTIGDWSVCVIAPVYGPVPISLSDEKYCDVTR